MIFLIAWLIGIIPAWLFIWPRLIDHVLMGRQPDSFDYGVSGVISLMIAVMWPIALTGLAAAQGISHLGRFLFEKHAS